MIHVGGIVGVTIVGLAPLAWGKGRAQRRPRVDGTRSARSESGSADDVAGVGQLRQSVLDRATAGGLRVAVSRSGVNPMTVAYTAGPSVHFYSSLDAFRRDIDARAVDPEYASWGRRAPLVIAEWSAAECRDWLSDHA